MNIRHLIPVPVKKCLKYTFYSFQDLRDKVCKTRNPDIPPRRLNFVGSHDFEKVGQEFFSHFTKIGGLKKDHKVLDIGSGIGRMAIPLTQYLDKASGGNYNGFDIDKRGVTWCQNNLTPKYPHFNFIHSDVYNLYYNKNGKISADNFVFPDFKNADKFDFIFATSVFTHMKSREIIQYLSEIKKVSQPGTTLFLTFFVITPETIENTKNGLSNVYFSYQDTDNTESFYSHKHNPEAEIGFTKDWIFETCAKSLGIKTDQITIHSGSWSGNKKSTSYQDILVIKM